MNRTAAFHIVLAGIMFLVYPCFILLIPTGPANIGDILVPSLTWIVPLCIGFASLGEHGGAAKCTENALPARGYSACVERRSPDVSRISFEEASMAVVRMANAGKISLGNDSEKLNAALPTPQRELYYHFDVLPAFHSLQAINAVIQVGIEGTASDGVYEEPRAVYPIKMEMR